MKLVKSTGLASEVLRETIAAVDAYTNSPPVHGAMDEIHVIASDVNERRRYLVSLRERSAAALLELETPVISFPGL